jgi:hypothetical protein
MRKLTEKERRFQVLLIDGLHAMGLPKENIIAIATMLQTEKQMGTMLDWIKKHYKENPSKLRVMLVATNIKNGVKE